MSDAAVCQPIDLEHLAGYTGADSELCAEVLNLFAQQSAEAMTRLRKLGPTPDHKIWRDTLHTLKGSAMGVGAFALADELALAELINPERRPDEAAAALAAVERGSRLVNAFIAAYLAS